MENIFEKIKRKNAEIRQYLATLQKIDVPDSMFCYAQSALTVALANALALHGCAFRFGEDGGVYFTVRGATVEFPDDMQAVVKKELAALVTLPAPDLLTRPIINKQDLVLFLDQADQITEATK